MVSEQENWDGLAYVCVQRHPPPPPNSVLLKNPPSTSPSCFLGHQANVQHPPTSTKDIRIVATEPFYIVLWWCQNYSEMNYTYSLVLWILWCVRNSDGIRRNHVFFTQQFPLANVYVYWQRSYLDFIQHIFDTNSVNIQRQA